MIWILEHFSTPEPFSYTQILSPQRTPSFFYRPPSFEKRTRRFKKTSRRLKQNAPKFFLKRLGAGNADGLHHKIHHFLL